MRLLRAGKSYKEVAKKLGVSENTVRTVVRRAYDKLGVTSRFDLPRV